MEDAPFSPAPMSPLPPQQPGTAAAAVAAGGGGAAGTGGGPLGPPDRPLGHTAGAHRPGVVTTTRQQHIVTVTFAVILQGMWFLGMTTRTCILFDTHLSILT